MKRDNEEITDLFRSRLAHTELTVCDDFWDKLQQDIPVAMHRRRLVFCRIVAAASVLLVLAASSAAFLFFSPQEKMEQAFTQLAASASGSLSGDVVNQPPPPPTAQPVLQQPAHTNVGLFIPHKQEEDSISMTVSMSFSFTTSVTGRHSKENNLSDESAWKATHTNTEQPQRDTTVPLILSTTSKQNTVVLKAALGTALPAQHGIYKAPISGTVTLERSISKLLSIEAGLSYSHLRTAGRELNYIGIPLKLNITLAEISKWDVYASIGGVADKCVTGAPSNGFNSEPIQLAVTAGAGVRYKINNQLALFAEPGVSHHFKTDSKLATLRTERPTNLQLFCGVCMTY